MSLTTRPLRLHLLSVLGTPLAGAKVTLQLSAYQADGTDIVPLVWALPEDPAVPGDYFGPIWPNTRGDGGTHYDLLVQANGQVLLTQVVTVVAGAAPAVLKAKINAAPYPAVYAAAVAVSSANTFSDAAGESASRALAAVGTVSQVVEDYGTVGAAAAFVSEVAGVVAQNADISTAKAEEAVTAKTAAESDRILAQAAAASAAVSLAAKDTIALGRTAVADGQSFWVKPNATDGLKRFTCFLRASSTTQTTVGALTAGGEFDLSFQPESLLIAYGQALAWAVQSAGDKRVPLAITQDGTVLGKLAIDAAGGLVVAWNAATGRTTVTLNRVGGVVPSEVPGLYLDGDSLVDVKLDLNGRIIQGVTSDGTGYQHKARIDTLRVKNLTADNLPPIGPVMPFSLLKEICLSGDSLTAPAPNTAAWAAATGWPVVNRGIGGQRSRQGAGRFGGRPVALTFSSDTIAGGSNTITAIDGAAIVAANGASQAQWLSTGSSGATITQRGRVSGVLGLVTRSVAGGVVNGAETYTFTPDVGQTVGTYAPPGSTFVPEDNSDVRRVVVFGWGRNDDWADLAGLMSHLGGNIQRLLDAGNPRFVVVTPPNGDYSSELKGQSRYVQLRAIEEAITAKWPNNAFNMRRWLIDKGLAALGLTPTTQDLADIANDTVPTSLRTDNVHFIAGVYAPAVLAIKAQIIEPKGWLL